MRLGRPATKRTTDEKLFVRDPEHRGQTLLNECKCVSLHQNAAQLTTQYYSEVTLNRLGFLYFWTWINMHYDSIHFADCKRTRNSVKPYDTHALTQKIQIYNQQACLLIRRQFVFHPDCTESFWAAHPDWLGGLCLFRLEMRLWHACAYVNRKALHEWWCAWEFGACVIGAEPRRNLQNVASNIIFMWGDYFTIHMMHIVHTYCTESELYIFEFSTSTGPHVRVCFLRNKKCRINLADK